MSGMDFPSRNGDQPPEPDRAARRRVADAAGAKPPASDPKRLADRAREAAVRLARARATRRFARRKRDDEV